jgi:hypothetical protein
VVPSVELHQLIFPFVEKSKIKITTLIANDVYRPTAMGFINMLEHLRVVILQYAAEMLIAGRTHYLFLHEVFSCQLFKDFVKVMMIRTWSCCRKGEEFGGFWRGIGQQDQQISSHT